MLNFNDLCEDGVATFHFLRHLRPLFEKRLTVLVKSAIIPMFPMVYRERKQKNTQKGQALCLRKKH